MQNYDRYMREYAYGYDITKGLEDLKAPILILARTPRLFIEFEYIASDKFINCEAQKFQRMS